MKNIPQVTENRVDLKPRLVFQVAKHAFGKHILRFQMRNSIKNDTLGVKLTLAPTSPCVEVINT